MLDQARHLFLQLPRSLKEPKKKSAPSESSAPETKKSSELKPSNTSTATKNQAGKDPIIRRTADGVVTMQTGSGDDRIGRAFKAENPPPLEVCNWIKVRSE